MSTEPQKSGEYKTQTDPASKPSKVTTPRPAPTKMWEFKRSETGAYKRKSD